MKKITKIYLDNNHVINCNFKPLQYFKDDTDKNYHNPEYQYRKQFEELENEILELLPQDKIKEYAERNFDLVEDKHEEVEEITLSDFSNAELLLEIKERGILGASNNIYTEDFLMRFSKIMERENAIILERVLTEFESKLNL